MTAGQSFEATHPSIDLIDFILDIIQDLQSCFPRKKKMNKITISRGKNKYLSNQQTVKKKREGEWFPRSYYVRR